MMRRIVPLVLAACVAVICVLSILQADLSWMSSRCVIAAMLSGMVVVFPLVAGAGCVDAVIATSRNIMPMISAMPFKARLRLAFSRSLSAWYGGCAGLGLSTLGGIIVAAINQSMPSWQTFILLPLAVLALLAGAMFGWLVGIVLHFWFVPPLLVVASYVLVASNFGGARSPWILFGGQAPWSAFLLPNWSVYLAAALYFLAVGVAAIIMIASWANSEKGRPKLLAIASAVVVIGVAWSGNISYVAEVSVRDQLNVMEDSDSWPCAELQSGLGTVCIPPDQIRDLDTVVAELSPTVARLVEVDPALRGKAWKPGFDNTKVTFSYGLPLGAPPVIGSQTATVVSGITQHCLWEVEDESKWDEALRGEPILTAWLASNTPAENNAGVQNVSLEQARQAYAELMRCGK